MYKKEMVENFGRLGESFVRLYFTRLGKNVIMSEDKYDHNKDMTIDGVETEVKTEVPFYRCFFEEDSVVTPAFTIPKTDTQYNKCKNVEQLLFVCVDSYTNKVHILRAPKASERKIYEVYVPAQRTNRYAIKVEDCSLVYTTKTHDVYYELAKYNTSYFSPNEDILNYVKS